MSMNTTHSHGLLTTPVHELALSKELTSFMIQWGFGNLGDLLSTYSIPQLLAREGFDYHCLVEVYRLLEDYGCEGVIRE